MLSRQELSDRFEIQDLLYRYAELIDGKRFQELRDDVFHADAHIDYSAFGGSVGDREETIAFLKKAMPLFPNTQQQVLRCDDAVFFTQSVTFIFDTPISLEIM